MVWECYKCKKNLDERQTNPKKYTYHLTNLNLNTIDDEIKTISRWFCCDECFTNHLTFRDNIKYKSKNDKILRLLKLKNLYSQYLEDYIQIIKELKKLKNE